MVSHFFVFLKKEANDARATVIINKYTREKKPYSWKKKIEWYISLKKKYSNFIDFHLRITFEYNETSTYTILLCVCMSVYLYVEKKIAQSRYTYLVRIFFLSPFHNLQALVKWFNFSNWKNIFFQSSYCHSLLFSARSNIHLLVLHTHTCTVHKS